MRKDGKKNRWIEGKIDPRDFLCQDTTGPVGREATPRDIGCNHKAVIPKAFDPFVLEGNHRTNILPQ